MAGSSSPQRRASGTFCLVGYYQHAILNKLWHFIWPDFNASFTYDRMKRFIFNVRFFFGTHSLGVLFVSASLAFKEENMTRAFCFKLWLEICCSWARNLSRICGWYEKNYGSLDMKAKNMDGENYNLYYHQYSHAKSYEHIV